MVPIPHNAVPYRQRYKVEIMSGRLKGWRRIHTRYDRSTHTFSPVYLAATVNLWPCGCDQSVLTQGAAAAVI